MNILDIRVMKGPNYWSIRRHKLVVMKLDIEELEDLPTNKIAGFSERLFFLQCIRMNVPKDMQADFLKE